MIMYDYEAFCQTMEPGCPQDKFLHRVQEIKSVDGWRNYGFYVVYIEEMELHFWY